MNYVDRLLDLAEESLTDKGFKLLLKIENGLPDIWDRPSSSTGKYHQKANGEVPSIIEHTFGMFYAATKIIRLFGHAKLSTQNDAILIGIIQILLMRIASFRFTWIVIILRGYLL